MIRSGFVILLIIASFAFAHFFLPLSLLFLLVIAFLAMSAILILYRPAVFFVGLLLVLPLVFLTHNVRFLFLGMNTRPGVTGLNPQTFLIAFSILFFVFYVLTNRLVGKNMLKSPILIPMFGFLVVSAVGLLLTPNLAAAIPDLLRSAGGLLIFLIAYVFLKEEKMIVSFMQLFILVLFVPLVIGYLQLFSVIPYTSAATKVGALGLVNRVSCGYYDPLTLWIFMLFYYPILLFLYRQPRIFLTKAILHFSFAFPLPVLYFTYYRAGLAILFAEILLWFLFMKKKRLAFVITLITALFITTQWQTFSSFYESVWQPFVGPTVGEAMHAGFHGRVAVWTSYLRFYSEQHALNKLIGLGPYVGDPHNNFLWILLATGAVGLGLYTWLLVTIYREINLCIKYCRERIYFNFSVMTKVFFVAFLIIGITTEPSTDIGFQWYLFTLLSVIAKINWDRRGSLMNETTGA